MEQVAHKTGLNSEQLFYELLHAEDEYEVIKILDDQGYSLDNRDVWTPLGNNPGNFSTVGNQQEDASAAIIEKLINSIDAVLLSECYGADIDPESDVAPNTMPDAVDQFLGIKNGRLDYLSSTEQTEIADKIHLVAVGEKTSPSYCIIDKGEGQTPNQFSETFLSTTRSSPKVKINFVQGKFNAGSTGSLQFCGKQNIQLIASRRQPHAPVNDDDTSKDMWGFTVIRRRRPNNQGVRSSVFEYLSPNGEVPRFDAPYVQVLPGQSKKNKPAEAYSQKLQYGTCVKLYNYRWSARSNATLECRREIERLFQVPCLPFRISESRQYRANYYSTTVIGIWNTIRMDDPDAEKYKMENGFPASEEISLEDFGKIPIKIGVWKEEIDTRRYPKGIYFLVNGQVHEKYGRDFISRRLKLDYIEDHLLVAVDCTNINRGTWEDLSLGSRDRFRKNEEHEALKTKIIEELSEHPGLKELNALRRQKRREETPEAPAEVKNMLNELLKNDPGLATFFGIGGSLLTGTGPGATIKFDGKKFPTYFKLAKEPKGGLVKTCPVNRTVKIEFDTDAENEYFSRPDEHGEVEVFPTPDLIETSRLWNGKLTIKFRTPWDAKPGDEVDMKISISDVTRIGKGPFISEFKIVADKAIDKAPKPGTPNPHGDPRSSNISSTSTSLSMPEPVEVKMADWNKYGFANQSQALRIKHSDDGYDFYLNVDNSTLITEMANIKNDPAVIKHWFKWGLVISALALIRDQETQETMESQVDDFNVIDSDESGPDLRNVMSACDGLSRVIIPIIRSLHDGP